jgi:DNA-directed RNA polymerase specialized sigma24 family protein
MSDRPVMPDVSKKVDPRVVAVFADLAPRLRAALTAFGGLADVEDAVADTFEHRYSNTERVLAMRNPDGYLYRVARSKVTKPARKHPTLPDVPTALAPEIEPGLPAALATLTVNQRVSVFLIAGVAWTPGEVGEFLGIGESSVRNHYARGMAKLRVQIGEVQP